MDGYQSIVNMQLLAIEKTLLAVDQYLHTDYSSEIADLVTNLGMSIHNLLNKMQKVTCYVSSISAHCWLYVVSVLCAHIT